MRKGIFIILAIFCSVCAVNAFDYVTTARKAARYFENEEWANAEAQYMMLIPQKPGDAANYAHAIVAASMLDDTTVTINLMNQALQQGIPFDSVFSSVEKTSFKIGKGDLYENFLKLSRNNFPYLLRPINSYLLKYYTFRKNGAQMIKYAERMLGGNPNNIDFLSILAKGYMLEGKMQDAMVTWHRVLALNPDNYDACIYIANYYYENKKYEMATPYFERAYKLFPTPYVENILSSLTKNRKEHKVK